MHIITPDKEIVKRKITDKKNPTCRMANLQAGFKIMKAMHNINPDKEFVKSKISEVGEKPCWLCVDGFHNQQPREDSLTSVDINPQGDPKNAVGTILTSLKGDSDVSSKGDSDDSLGSRKSEVGGGGGSPLLDSIVISREEHNLQQLNSEYQGIEEIEFEKYKGKRENCNSRIVTFECRNCGLPYHTELGCGLRTCPDCAKDRVYKVFTGIYNIAKRVKLKKYRSFKMITFSYGFEQYTPHSTAINKVKQAFTKIWNNILKQKGAGAVVSIELGEKNLSIHIHCLYYGGFIPRKTLIKEWKKHTGKWYVDIRKIRGQRGIKEVIKYITKGLLDMSYKRAFEIEKALKGQRRFITYGIFYARVQEKKFECPVCRSQDWRFVSVENADVGTNETMLMQRQFFREFSKVEKTRDL